MGAAFAVQWRSMHAHPMPGKLTSTARCQHRRCRPPDSPCQPGPKRILSAGARESPPSRGASECRTTSRRRQQQAWPREVDMPEGMRTRSVHDSFDGRRRRRRAGKDGRGASACVGILGLSQRCDLHKSARPCVGMREGTTGLSAS
eukprot:scaffold3767_cov114-Isochrysis_galbana.AAC.37